MTGMNMDFSLPPTDIGLGTTQRHLLAQLMGGLQLPNPGGSLQPASYSNDLNMQRQHGVHTTKSSIAPYCFYHPVLVGEARGAPQILELKGKAVPTC